MDAVNHPQHYTSGKIEVIEFIEDQELGFHLGNALKYICRAGLKDHSKYVEDLEKAIWYIRRRIGIALKEEGKALPRPNDMQNLAAEYCPRELVSEKMLPTKKQIKSLFRKKEARS